MSHEGGGGYLDGCARPGRCWHQLEAPRQGQGQCLRLMRC